MYNGYNQNTQSGKELTLSAYNTVAGNRRGETRDAGSLSYKKEGRILVNPVN